MTIFADAEVDWSPRGTGTAAVMAVLSEMGAIAEDGRSCTKASGTVFTGRIVGCRGEKPAIVRDRQGSAGSPVSTHS